MYEDAYEIIKNSIARIGCVNVKTEQLESIGTAFLIAVNLVMTARHNIENYINNKSDIRVELIFRCNQPEDKRIIVGINKIIYGEKSDELDIAILELDSGIHELMPLKFAKFKDINTSTIRHLEWITYGFPVIQSPNNLRTFEGYILDSCKVEKWDLDLRWNGLEQINSEGLSGAPLIIEYRVIGVVTTEFLARLGAKLGAISTVKLERILKNICFELTEIDYNKCSNDDTGVIVKKCHALLPLNRKFVGRKTELQKLENMLMESDSVVLVGLAGVGKTQLANQYAHKHKAEYDVICWLNAEDEKTLELEYFNFAKELSININKEVASVRDISIQVNKKLHGLKVIYILDNARRSNELLKCLVTGHKSIITSRKSDWIGEADDQIPINGLAREDSIGFILNQLKVQDEINANLLARELGDYPLALEQATAYILNKQTISIKQYLERYMNLKGTSEVELEKRLFSNVEILKNYDKTLRRVLQITFDELENESPQAIYLLNMCGFMSPDIIPKELFIENKELLCREIYEFKDYINAFELDFEEKVIDPLIKYSLINWNIEQNGFQIHRMVQQNIRVNIIEEVKYKPFINIVLKIIESSFNYHRYEMNAWKTCKMLLAHVIFIVSKGMENYDEENTESLLKILEKLINYSKDMLIFANLNESLEAIDSLISRNEEKYEIYRIMYFYHFGCIYETTGKYREAIDIFQKGLTLSHKYEVLPMELQILNKIGDMYLSINKYELALKYFKNVFERREFIIEEESSNKAALLINMGASLKGLNHFDKARDCIESAIEICDNLENPNLTEKSRGLNYLGLILHALGEYEDSIIKFEEACNIAIKIYGDNHNKVAIYLSNIGYSYEGMNLNNKAIEYYEKAYNIFNINDEFITKDRSANLRNLAVVYDREKSFEKSIEFYNKSIKMDKDLFGDYSGDVLDGYLGLGFVYIQRGESVKILETFEYIITGLTANSDLNKTIICKTAALCAEMLAMSGFNEFSLKFKNLASRVENARETIPGRNTLCPCGSGRKYKKCCIKDFKYLIN